MILVQLVARGGGTRGAADPLDQPDAEPATSWRACRLTACTGPSNGSASCSSDAAGTRTPGARGLGQVEPPAAAEMLPRSITSFPGQRRGRLPMADSQRETTTIGAVSCGHGTEDRVDGPVTGPRKPTRWTRTAHSPCIAPRGCSLPDLI
jgi:hypothetical protein